MTERTSQSKQILDKLDVLTAEVFNLKGDIAAIQKQIEMQPKIDQQSFDSLKQANTNCQSSNGVRFTSVEERVKKVEENQTWLSRTVIGSIIGIVLTAIYSITKGL